jgi:hypothetical protein
MEVEPADSEIETTEYFVQRDLFGPLDLNDPLDSLDATSPRVEVLRLEVIDAFDVFDVAPTWVDAIDDQDEAA